MDVEATGPHGKVSVLTAGQPLATARFAMIMVHGRGATAEDILSLADELPHSKFAYLAPQARGNVWYPNSFLAPISSNEPWLSSSMSVLEGLLAAVNESGISADRTVLLGFSQGACLATEFAARHARRYAGVVGLSGGLIGPDGTSREYAGSLDGTPCFFGCSDVDFHIPKERVLETQRILSNLGGAVTVRLYPNMGHNINTDELDFVNSMLEEIEAGA